MDRNRATQQLALIRAFVRGARKHGTLDDGFRQRAADIVERTATAVAQDDDEDDAELSELLASVREELAAR